MTFTSAASPSPARSRGWRRVAAGLLLSVAALPALGQYQWRDANGRMVFSDQPPPMSVKPSQVLRADPMPAPPPAPRPATRPENSRDAAADRELARRQQADQQARKDGEDRQKAEQATRLARACEEARTELRTLESGMRMARVNPEGEREYLSDDERDKRMERIRGDLAQRCAAS